MKKKEIKKFYNQEEIKIVEYDEYYELSYSLDISSTYGFQYYLKLDEEIKNFFDTVKLIENKEKPVLFTILGDFDLLKDAIEENIAYFQIAVINIFISHIIKDKDLKRERRLGVPKTLQKVNLSSLILMDLINKELEFPIFSIQIVNENGTEDEDGNTEFETVYEVF